MPERDRHLPPKLSSVNLLTSSSRSNLLIHVRNNLDPEHVPITSYHHLRLVRSCKSQGFRLRSFCTYMPRQNSEECRAEGLASEKVLGGSIPCLGKARRLAQQQRSLPEDLLCNGVWKRVQGLQGNLITLIGTSIQQDCFRLQHLLWFECEKWME